jgi:hypothetical protein
LQPQYERDILFLMTVELDRDVEEYLTQRLHCEDPRKAVNDLIRHIRDQQEVELEATPELEARLLEAVDKPTSPLTSADFDAIEERVLARHKAKQK